MAMSFKHARLPPKSQHYLTPGVDMRSIKPTIRTKEEADALRKAFTRGPRQNFLKKAQKEARDEDLVEMGFDPSEIQAFRESRELPQGFAVHHVVPLKAGGTNDLDNLVLIRDEPEHKLFTSWQEQNINQLPPGPVGQPLEIPVPGPGVAWPTKGNSAVPLDGGG